MSSKATPAAAPVPRSSTDAPGVAGKWIVIGVFGLALAGAVGSWVFRYNATHRVAGYWGAKNAILIRDAPRIDFYSFVSGEVTLNDPDLLQKLTQPGAGNKVDVSQARGMVHLRNALTEDRSFAWQATPAAPLPVGWVLRFSNPATQAEVSIAFSKSGDFCRRLDDKPDTEIISCEPISRGLLQVFQEFSAAPPIAPPESR